MKPWSLARLTGLVLLGCATGAMAQNAPVPGPTEASHTGEIY